MTSKRMGFLKELLSFMGLKDRLRLEWISSAEAQKFVKVVTEFTEQIRRLGPSPLNRGQELPVDSDLAPAVTAAAGTASACGGAKPAATS
jgi:ribosomal 50S subunit-associated protein YjgA (DUF615 family)